MLVNSERFSVKMLKYFLYVTLICEMTYILSYSFNMKILFFSRDMTLINIDVL